MSSMSSIPYSYPPPQTASQIQQGMEDFQSMTEALGSGHIKDAQLALAKLRRDDPDFIPPGNCQADFANLKRAVVSGDLSSAQASLANITNAQNNLVNGATPAATASKVISPSVDATQTLSGSDITYAHSKGSTFSVTA